MNNTSAGASSFLVLPRWKQALVLIILNVMMIACLLYGFEYFLGQGDPRRHLPFHGYDQNGNYISWGYLVTVNRYGFREREFLEPKPPGVCRIMMLGDSFTWGTGVAVEERYGNLVEHDLNTRFAGARFELLNFGREGLATVGERDILSQFGAQVEPDLIIVAYYLDDTQPRGYTYRAELAQIYQTYPIEAIAEAMRGVALHHAADRLESSLEAVLVSADVVPTIEEGLQRTYETGSQEWLDFVEALADIKAMSDKMGLPAPLFIVLNDTRNLAIPTTYDTPDDQVDIYRRWAHQAERAAIAAGFRTLNYEPELAAQHYTQVNALDGHPSPEVHRLYAQKLYSLIAGDVQSGLLCPAASTH